MASSTSRRVQGGKLFDLLDTNGNGTIQKIELIDFCATNHVNVSKLTAELGMTQTHTFTRSNFVDKFTRTSSSVLDAVVERLKLLDVKQAGKEAFEASFPKAPECLEWINTQRAAVPNYHQMVDFVWQANNMFKSMHTIWDDKTQAEVKAYIAALEKFDLPRCPPDSKTGAIPNGWKQNVEEIMEEAPMHARRLCPPIFRRVNPNFLLYEVVSVTR